VNGLAAAGAPAIANHIVRQDIFHRGYHAKVWSADDSLCGRKRLRDRPMGELDL
jgi:hypothetical protein